MVSSDFAEPAIQSVQNKTDQLDKGGKIICMSDTMRNAIQIISVEKDGNDGVIVAFSDGTTGAYVVEELLGLRPCRQLGELPKDQNHTKTPTMN